MGWKARKIRKVQEISPQIPIGRSYKETVKRLYHEYGERMARRRM